MHSANKNYSPLIEWMTNDALENLMFAQIQTSCFSCSYRDFFFPICLLFYSFSHIRSMLVLIHASIRQISSSSLKLLDCFIFLVVSRFSHGS
jgi:hypothetical protein